MPRTTKLALFLYMALSTGAAAQTQALTPDQQLARDIFAELIGINTTHEHGNTTPAAQAVARRLLAAGFPAADVQVLGPRDQNQNVVARLRGTGKRKPILLLAHLDVVEALRSDWSLEPFVLTEKDGFFYGRGSSDIKDMAAIWVAALIRLKKEGFVPDRDIILALTAGEESGDTPDNGVKWLVQHHRELIDAAYCINGDAGDPYEQRGARVVRNVEASEKIYHDLQLETHNPGGHSSLPTPDNAIYHLSQALNRLAAYQFPVDLNAVTRGYFKALNIDTTQALRLAATSAFYNAQLRTTCVATRLEGGHANNALPQTARAVVNCRILPTENPDSIEATIRRVIADTAVKVTALDTAILSPPSPLVPEVLGPIAKITKDMWGAIPVVPNMETGATDGIYLRNAGMPVYGVSGVFLDQDDIRAHGRDERVGTKQYFEGLEFQYRLIKALSTARQGTGGLRD